MKDSVLLFIKLPPPITGATMMNLLVSKNMDIKEYFDVSTISISFANTVSELGKFKIRKIIKFFLIAIKLIKYLTIKNIKFVYFQISPTGVTFYRDLVYVLIIKLFKVRILYHLHGKGISCQIRRRFVKRIYKYVFNNEYVICLSNNLSKDIVDVYDGIPYIVNNGIEVVDEELNLDSISCKQDNFTILFLSNLLESKGVYEFLHILKILLDRRVTFKASIVGAEGDISEEMLNRILQDYNLNSIVTYWGPRFNKQKFDLIKESDILVYPTKNDAFPTVILEAMQMGIPIVATNEGAIPEIIDEGINGIIVKDLDPQLIADRIVELKNKNDLRNRMANNAREKFFREYTIEKFNNRISKVFMFVAQSIDSV